jgi:hypothetical protein
MMRQNCKKENNTQPHDKQQLHSDWSLVLALQPPHRVNGFSFLRQLAPLMHSDRNGRQ